MSFGSGGFFAHGHPREICQLELTGARRGSRGKINLPLLDYQEVPWQIRHIYCRPPGFAVMPMGRYLACGLQSGSAANLIGVQYKLEALSLEELLGSIIYRFRRI